VHALPRRRNRDWETGREGREVSAPIARALTGIAQERRGDASRLRGPPGPPTGQARVLGRAKQRRNLPDMHRGGSRSLINSGSIPNPEQAASEAAIQTRPDALGKRFTPTRPTGDGRSPPSFPRPSGWLDSVDVLTPYHSLFGSRRCSPPWSARGALPSSPRICWKLPGPGEPPAHCPAAPLHSP
jgi:hypothetical protein